MNLHEIMVKKFGDRRFTVNGDGDNQTITYFDDLPPVSDEELRAAEKEIKEEKEKPAYKRKKRHEIEIDPFALEALIDLHVYEDPTKLNALKVKLQRIKEEIPD